MSKSLFVSFEGGEGAGKSTLIENVTNTLERLHFSLVKTRAPGGTLVGDEIRNLLLHSKSLLAPRCELFLFLADRSQHTEEIIRPALKQGKVVLCDRFNDSTVAYQGAARGFGEEKVHELCQFATNGLNPNLTIYLDIDPEIGLKRITAKHDKIESEDIHFHQKIREAYHKIAKREPERLHIIDATLSVEEVLHLAMQLILPRLQ